ncbi:MAG: hypothetical protein AVDCRST_MAG36-2262 [uncultured Nocardioidaceae bacterium]|uniref:Uncharacterized protein n=1 Tax=uncultured Nocardioidaceae bacterium TaxID=253824 RepID=A0A6J4MBR9_9ACTN|nr:MAG: hypothetical protein AVDCRST_MAG36-2262 [uncultured Nocardioidaceae bacterium]
MVLGAADADAGGHTELHAGTTSAPVDRDPLRSLTLAVDLATRGVST